ncbi:hypothetical protein STSP2_01598 [Anaerohalosphaera lusitana]|uniref:Uncharacterized protein n=1 Tax=Anaerohalosphaera lusitana TaxID=1936003 RepID=A0A1U9NL30_9BACT|nr:hypothetical protein STSP2_01598 [Anaerohalosphaera lusitana]
MAGVWLKAVLKLLLVEYDFGGMPAVEAGSGCRSGAVSVLAENSAGLSSYWMVVGLVFVVSAAVDRSGLEFVDPFDGLVL